MDLEGIVHNGVIVPDDASELTEGTRVRVALTPIHATSVDPKAGSKHSILDIKPVSLGAVLQPLDDEDDLLDEMLEDRA